MKLPKRLVSFVVVCFLIALFPPFLLVSMLRNMPFNRVLGSFEYSKQVLANMHCLIVSTAQAIEFTIWLIV